MNRPARRSSGCFGCLWTGALLLGTVVPAAILWWMQPVWLDRLMFWRAQPPPASTIVVSAGEAPPPADITVRDRIRFWEDVAVRATASAATDTTLVTIEGSTVVFPPGSVPDGTSVVAVPVAHLPRPMAGRGDVFAFGPVHDLRIGDQEHWRFTKPIQITMPFDPATLPDGGPPVRPAIGTWQGGRWVELPSVFDPEKRTVSARTGHASLIAVLVVGGATLSKFTEAGQGLVIWLTRMPGETYKTPNFALHYDSSGTTAVVSDADYPLATGRKRKKEDPPLFVKDMGTYLEEARKELPRVEMKVAERTVWRWDVFLVPLNVDGLSAMGGPVLLDNDFRVEGSFAHHYGYLLRKTCIHELIHVAQDDFFNTFNANAARWWLEATAEYLAVRLLEIQGHPDPEPFRYLAKEPQLLATPFHLAPTMQAYAYARFLAWMQERGVDVVSLIKEINDQGEPGPDTLDYGLKKAGVRGGLLAMTLDFAEELHHRSLWNPRVISAEALNVWRTHPSSTLLVRKNLNPRDRFRILSWGTRGGKRASVKVHAYAEVTFSLPPLAVQAFDLQARSLPADRETRLVVQIPTPTRHTRVLLGTMKASRRIPYPGQPTPLVPVHGQAVTGRVASPAAAPEDINAATLLVANTSLNEPVPKVTVRRWLLMPPEWVSASRQEDGKISVSWGESVLKEEAGDRAFAGYNVYRKEREAPSYPDTPINRTPLQAEEFLDSPPTAKDWVYAVSVVDVAGNESEKVTIHAEPEPFEGVWQGRVRLLKGTVSKPVMGLIQSEIRKAGGAADQNVEKLLGPVKLLLGNIDLLLRLGVPMTIEVVRKGKLYELKATTLFGRPLQNQEPLMMKRTGRYTLAVVGDNGKVLPERSITLKKADVLLQSYHSRYNDPDVGTGEIGVQLSFHRQSEKVQPRP